MLICYKQQVCCNYASSSLVFLTSIVFFFICKTSIGTYDIDIIVIEEEKKSENQSDWNTIKKVHVI